MSSSNDGGGKPRQPPAKPGGPAPKGPAKPLRPSQSAFELEPVTGRGRPAAPKKPGAPPPTQSGPWSDFEPTVSGPRSPSMADLRRITGSSAVELPRVGAKPKADKAEITQPLTLPPQRKPSVIQKQLQSSQFDDDEHTQIDAVLGNVRSLELDADEESQTGTSEVYDGETPAEGTTDPEGWKAINAPVQSRPGRRSGRIYWSVIDQFAVGHNRRYDPDAPLRPRSHLFVWDVSRAMGCEVPHFVGGREMTVGQTVDWVRLESLSRGWRKLDAASALAAADRGELVLALPRDPKLKLVVVVRPGGAGDDGFPRVAGANAKRGTDLGAREVLGPLIEYFGHA